MRCAGKIVPSEVRPRLTAVQRRQRRARLSRRLVGYTASAGAALAVAATASPANATVIYDQGFTGPVTAGGLGTITPPQSVNLSTGAYPGGNFSFGRFSLNIRNTTFGSIHLNPNGVAAGKNWGVATYGAVQVGSAMFNGAKNFAAGAVIGPGAQFAKANVLLGIVGSSGTVRGGAFVTSGGKKEGYLGIKFTSASGTTLYGWIDVTVDDPLTKYDFLTATINGWAYESSGGSIQAGAESGGVPEPASLALLAVGALGAAGWAVRRRWKKQG